MNKRAYLILVLLVVAINTVFLGCISTENPKEKEYYYTGIIFHAQLGTDGYPTGEQISSEITCTDRIIHYDEELRKNTEGESWTNLLTTDRSGQKFVYERVTNYKLEKIECLID